MAGRKGAVVKKATAPRKTPAKRAGERVAQRGRPQLTTDVKAAVVESIPPDGYERTRQLKYATILAEIRAKVGRGKPVIVATYSSRGSATVVKNALENGERAVDGKVGDWEFTARRTDDGGSVLYARLL